jgi:hypothetical protein
VHTDIKIKIYRTIIFPVLLYGCETWSLTLKEKLIQGEKNVWTEEGLNDGRIGKTVQRGDS